MPDIKLFPPFRQRDQEHEAAWLGMWTFLVTEVLLFGGIFTGYAALRFVYPGVFQTGSHCLHLVLGSLNTFVLLTSSLTMALAVAHYQAKRSTWLWLLGVTIALGLTFLGIKGWEWGLEFHDQLLPLPGLPFRLGDRDRLFFVFYFLLTGLHALHLLIGTGLVGTLILVRQRWTKQRAVELVGLYWHFIDIVWLFIFPALYLV